MNEYVALEHERHSDAMLLKSKPSEFAHTGRLSNAGSFTPQFRVQNFTRVLDIFTSTENIIGISPRILDEKCCSTKILHVQLCPSKASNKRNHRRMLAPSSRKKKALKILDRTCRRWRYRSMPSYLTDLKIVVLQLPWRWDRCCTVVAKRVKHNLDWIHQSILFIRSFI